MKFIQTDYGNYKDISKLVNGPRMDIPVTVSGTAGQTMEAGTIIGGIAGSVLEDDTIMVEEKNTQGGATGSTGAAVDAEGILIYDVTFDSNGEAEGAMRIFGDVDLGKLPTAPVAEAKEALDGKIFFIK